MFRKSIYKKLGGFSEKPEQRYVEDYPTYSLFARHSRVANIETPLVTHRGHCASVSAQNEAEQTRQSEAVQQSNLCWILGCDSLSQVAWTAWRKFVFPDSKTAPFKREEVNELHALLPLITSSFYAAYGFESSEEIARHRQRTLYPWARHAIGLSYKPGKATDVISRFALACLGIRLLMNILFPAKTTRSGQRRSFTS
jgi:hypothetical protein